MNKKALLTSNEFSKQTEDQNTKLNIFLSKIHSTIENIRKTKGKKYSLLSSIFNCFYENKSLLLSKQFIYNYLLEDIINYKGKMISTFFDNRSMKEINKDNYIRYAYRILTRNKCIIIENNDKFSIDINFIYSHQNLMEKILFDNDEQIFNNYNPKLNKKEKNLLNKNNIQKEEDEKIDDDDYTIEIIEDDQDEDEDIEINKGNTISTEIDNKESNIIKEGHSLDYEQFKINNINNTSQPSEIFFLNKKRKIVEEVKINELENSIKNNNIKEYIGKEDANNENYNISFNEEEKDDKMNKANLESEILSLIESGNKIISLFQEKELVKEEEEENKYLNDNKSFNELILANYQNENNLKEYLDNLNDDYSKFRKSIKSLIDCKSFLDQFNSNKFLGKITVMNKIITEKEKCSLLIEKITNKLKQIFMEYDYIIKIISFFELNKCEFFIKLNEIMKFYMEKEKDIYVYNIAIQMKEELRKAFDITKEENRSLCKI